MSYSLPVGYVNAAFYQSPHKTPDLDPEPALLAVFAGATVSLDFAIYSLTLPAVADAIIAARDRGVAVRGLVDGGQMASPSSQVPRLAAAGIDLRKWGGSFRLMHDKAFVVDGATAGLGSYNWTASAEKENYEVLLICHGAQVARGLGPALTTQIAAGYAAGHPVTA